MSAAAELDGLLNRLVDDLLDDPDAARLQDLLRGDGAARRRYRQVLALHAGLQWDYVAAAREARPAQGNRAARWWMPWSAVAAALLVASAALLSWPARGAPVLLTISSLGNGSLTWNDGATQRVLDASDGVPAGRLMLEGDSAVAVLRFADDTSLTLTGDTELAVDGTLGKRLDLRHGLLTAEVAPQPAGRPLVITTPTASLEVLGTVFTVGSGADVTTLAVEQGRVRLERIADRQSVEVAAGQQTHVSFDASRTLTISARPHVPDTWRVDFAQRPPSHWSGTWTAPAEGSVGVFGAVPYVAGRDAAGKPFMHHGVRVNAPSGNRPFVRLHADSRLTVRFRLTRGEARGPFKVMLCMMRDGAAFGGTFFASLDPQACPVDSAGWRTAVLAMPAFVPTRPATHPTPIGHSATFILVNTVTRPAGLEVASIAVDLP